MSFQTPLLGLPVDLERRTPMLQGAVHNSYIPLPRHFPLTILMRRLLQYLNFKQDEQDLSRSNDGTASLPARLFRPLQILLFQLAFEDLPGRAFGKFAHDDILLRNLEG